ncbi:MAG: ROK family protein [bacterium]|nr:ROK family protein [bacterium]
MRTFALGIDIGGTSAKIALVGPGGRVARRASVAMDPRAGWREMLGRIADAAAAVRGARSVAGAGVGCPGCVDAGRGILHLSPNLPLWTDVPVRRFMERRLGLPCAVDNDVNMTALGEFRHGAARGMRHVLCITLGTGVGGGLIIDGSLYRGGAGAAGEIGHVPIVPDGLACGCGGRGCLERYVGRDGILRLARAGMKNPPADPAALAAAARGGDRAAAAVWEKVGSYLGLGLAAVINLLNPDGIVVGGGIAGAGNLLLAPARRVARARALRVPASHVRIVRSGLGGDAGVIGAASEAAAAAGSG